MSVLINVLMPMLSRINKSPPPRIPELVYNQCAFIQKMFMKVILLFLGWDYPKQHNPSFGA